MAFWNRRFLGKGFSDWGIVKSSRDSRRDGEGGSVLVFGDLRVSFRFSSLFGF